MDKPTHPLSQLAFLLAVAVPLLLALCFAIDRSFVDHPDAAGIFAAERQLFRSASAAHDLLDRMIARDEVTWDPTNGARIGRVLAHLKRAAGPKLLMVGSSQLLVVRDDRSPAGVARRVDKALDHRLGGRVTVYNLSLGEMTLAEKTWVLEQAIRLAEFDYIVVGMTLWDSVSDDVRPWLAHPRDPLPERPGSLAPTLDWPDPATINRMVTDRFTQRLKEAVPFFQHRTAIQRWLANGAMRTLVGDDRRRAMRFDNPPPAHHPQAEPLRYSYSDDQQPIILDRVGKFLASLQSIRASSGAAIMVFLTPIRQDPDRPVYSPPAFYRQFRDVVERACARDRFVFLDASSLLGRSHFGIYADGPDAGRIDVLHFDASGHGELAEAIEESSLFGQVLRAAG